MRSDDLYPHEIVVAARAVEGHLERGGAGWVDDPTIRDAVLYRLTVIGEAAGKVSDELRSRHTDVPWARVRAFRNTAIHEYFAVEWHLVKRIAEADTPVLRGQVVAVLRLEFPEVAARLEEGS